MNQTAHVSQLLEENTLYVEGDNGLIHITTRLHLNGARIAVSAMEYCIGENDEESEHTVPVGDAVVNLANSSGNCRPATIDNQYAVVDACNQLRILAWKNEDNVMCTVEVY